MSIIRICFAFFLFLFAAGLYANNDTTIIQVNLNSLDKGKLKIKVYPPNGWSYASDFVIPTIIPGTYLKINYHRFYSSIEAYDELGQKVKLKKQKNRISFKPNSTVDYLQYEVKQSWGDQKIWDNILPSAGTIFKPNVFLMNCQLVFGYFEGFEDQPFQLELIKDINLYGSTAMRKIAESDSILVLSEDSYAAMIDHPILLHLPDTLSFKVDDATFHISVYSESAMIKAEQVLPKLKRLMHGMKEFTGGLVSKDYHFLLYFASKDSLKGLFKGFGLSSALEHKNSSVYYLSENTDTSFKYLNYIAAHEYLHTWAPLSISTTKISDFNFDTPEMSRHLWFYEGVTDYLASLMTASQKIPTYHSFSKSIANAISSAEKWKARSMTESSQNIINHSIFDWLGKIIQLSNFYEKGKLIAFALDMELYIESQGTFRLKDLMSVLHTQDSSTSFEDQTFLLKLNELSPTDISDFTTKYIENDLLPPYQQYLNRMGRTYISKGEKRSIFGDLHLRYDSKIPSFYISEDVKKHQFLKGDTIIKVNNQLIDQSTASNLWFALHFPYENEFVEIEFKRGNKVLYRKLKADKKVLNKSSFILRDRAITKEQIQFYKSFMYLE